MKKFLLFIFGLLFKWGGLLSAFYFVGEVIENQGGSKALILGVLCFIVFIVGWYMRHRSKFTCWCGGDGNVINSEYLGSNTSYTDTSNGFKKNITKKYLLTCQCNKCGKQWTTKSKKELTERHNF